MALPVGVADRKKFAVQLHQEASTLRDAVGRGIYELALRLFLLKRYELWREVDPELRSFEEYLEVYRFGDWARGKAYALIGQIRDFVLSDGLPDDPAELPAVVAQASTRLDKVARVGWSKLELVRPAVNRGVVAEDEAIADAESLGYKDLRRKYRRLLGDEARPSCHDCVHLHTGDRARGDRLVAFFAGSAIGHDLDVLWRYCPMSKRVWIEGPSPGEAERVAAECRHFECPDSPVVGGVADQADQRDHGERVAVPT